MGDFNMPDINWLTLSGHSGFSNQLCDLVFEFNLSQLVDQSTHICGNILDLVLTNCHDHIGSLIVHSHGPHIVSSDHYLISFNILDLCSSRKEDSPTSYVYNFVKGDYTSLNNYLNTYDFSAFYDSTDVEQAWSFIKQCLTTAIDLFIPKIRSNQHHYPKWFTSDLKHQLNRLRTLRKKLRSHFTLQQLQKLITAEEAFQLSLNQAKSSYESGIINQYVRSKNPKIYQYIKSITKSSSLPSILKYNQLTVNTDLDKANVFNKYFFSVYTDNSSCSLDLSHPQPPSQLADISITHDEVFQVLCSLNTNKASGSDNIGPTLLKNCASSLTYPLHHLFSLSLQTSVIPSEWKYHTIIPIFKADDKSNVKNYRPISLLSNISKVLERIVYNRTLQITTNFITHTQFGFCKSKSTLQQLLLYFNDLCSTKYPIHSIYLDYSKAFDKVSHKILRGLWG